MTKTPLNVYGDLIVYETQKRGRWPTYLVQTRDGNTVAVFRSYNKARDWALENC